MNTILYFFIFFNLILYIKTEIEIWKFENSSINLLFSEPYRYVVYDESKNGYRLKLEKILSKNNEEITQKNYLQINNDNALEVPWEDIYNYYPIDNKLYICPKGSNYLSIYSNNTIEPKIYPENGIAGNWELSCYYYKNKNIMFISYLGSDDKNIYAIHLDDEKLEALEMHNGYYDIIWPTKIIFPEKFYVIALLKDDTGLILGRVGITLRDKVSSNLEGYLYVVYLPKVINTTFDNDRYYYWIGYDEYNRLSSGYSFNSIPDNIENIFFDLSLIIMKMENMESPFESFENIEINYVKIVKGTKYAYYQIKSSGIIYHGIIDIRSNQIIFNTNENITEIRSLSKYSLLAITNSSAYELCLKSKFNDKCVDKCPPGQKLEIDHEKGNYCNGDELCKNFIFKPNNTCVDKCNEESYIIIDKKECGLCKDLNRLLPYKVKNETFCRGEKPINTYIIDESLYLLGYCQSLCESCYGDQNDECLTCKNSFLFGGQCVLDCPGGYYNNKINKTCEECSSNCRTCSSGKENNNNHCSSCEANLYLVKGKDMDNNCVEKCPNDTVADDVNMECLSQREYQEKTKKKPQKGNKSLIVILIIVPIVIVIAIISVVLFIKFRNNKNNDNVNMILKSDDDNFNIHQNESYSQQSDESDD